MFLCVFINPTSQVDTPLLKYTVVIDAGHGGLDGGTIGVTTKVKESDLNLIYSKKLQKYLDNWKYCSTFAVY